LVGVAVKVTEVPAQIEPAGEAAILTLAGRVGLTVIVTAFDVAGLPVAQDSLEVNIHVTMLPEARVLLVKVGLFDPTAVPFTFHA